MTKLCMTIWVIIAMCMCNATAITKMEIEEELALCRDYHRKKGGKWRLRTAEDFQKFIGDTTNSADKGIVYIALAELYNENLELYSDEAVRYAKLALESNISVTKMCEMYRLISKTREFELVKLGWSESERKSEVAKPLISALSIVLKNLYIDDLVIPPGVDRFTMDQSDPDYDKFKERHQEQMKKRKKIMEQNQLLLFRDEFCSKLIRIFGKNITKNIEYKRLLENVVNNERLSVKVTTVLDQTAEMY